MKSRFACLAALSCVAIAPLTAAAQTTTMNVSTLSPYNNFDAMPQTFGDHANLNVTNTTVSDFGNQIGTTSVICPFVSLWNAGYSDLTGAAFACGNGYVGEFFFQPLNGGTVTLNSMQFGSWDSNGTCCGPTRTFAYNIYNGNWNLLAGFVGTVDATLTATPNVSSSTGLYLQWGTDWDVGINNITTTVGPTAVPEPSSIALLATGIVGIAGFARRRRSA